MKVNQSFRSPNFDPRQINVEFLVMHYTAGSLQSTLDIFANSEKKVSAHLVVAPDGDIYEVVQCWNGHTQRAWHAGKSHFNDGARDWVAFNDFSIGVEVVNLNGNFMPYSEQQYKALTFIIKHLKSLYPALCDPQRIIGHEQIAGFRGKIDPGWLFDWKRIFNDCFPGSPLPPRPPNLSAELKSSTEKYIAVATDEEKSTSAFWHQLSESLEKSSCLSNKTENL